MMLRTGFLLLILGGALSLSAESADSALAHRSLVAARTAFLTHMILGRQPVVPRGRALGVAFSLPDEDKYSRGKNWLMDRIRISFGGYAAEELIYGETTTGVQNDLEQATSMARRMVTEWGMSEQIGPMALGSEGEPIFLGKEIATHKDYSEETARQVDNEIRSLLSNCLNDVRALLKEHREQLEKLANELVVKETLDDTDIRNLLGFAPRVAITVE